MAIVVKRKIIVDINGDEMEFTIKEAEQLVKDLMQALDWRDDNNKRIYFGVIGEG